MIVEASVVPNSRRFSISTKEGRLKIHLASPPENNRANIELIKELTKLTGRSVRILSGASSKRKRIEIAMSEEEWGAFIRDLRL
jgi:uncharacterized protein (TIGR00251 family)